MGVFLMLMCLVLSALNVWYCAAFSVTWYNVMAAVISFAAAIVAAIRESRGF